MVYKIQNAKDLNTLPLMEEKLKELICYYTEGLSNPTDDTEDSGFILYVTSNTPHREIKALFDYTKHTLEYAELYDNICSATYLLNNSFVVTLLTNIEDTPIEILKELN